MQAKGIAWGLCAAVIWGGYLAFARAGVVAGLDAIDIAFVRFAIAGLCLSPWFFVWRSRICVAVPWPRAFVFAALVGVPFVFLGVGGFEFAPLAHGALLQPAALMVGSIVFAAWILNEAITAKQVAGVLIIALGLAFVVGPELAAPSGLLLLGDLMFVVSALMWALFATLQRFWAVPPVRAAAAVSVVSGALIVPPYLASRGLGELLSLPAGFLVSQVLIHGVLVGIVAVVAFTKSVSVLGAAKAACFPALVPAVALIIGIPATGETPTTAQWLGMAIVTTGLLLRTGIMTMVLREDASVSSSVSDRSTDSQDDKQHRKGHD